MNPKMAITLVAIFSVFSFGFSDQVDRTTFEKSLVSDSTQYWKSKAKMLEQQALNMARMNAEEAKLQHQAQMDCLKKSEDLQKLVDQQKKEIQLLKARKP